MGTSTILFIILAAIVAAILSFAQYFTKNKNKRAKHWILFSAFRFITYFCVFLLFINPEFVNTTYSIEKPTLVVAVDNSSSINELEQTSNVEAFIAEINAHPKINDRFSVETYSFGKNFKQNDSLDFSEKQSNLSTAFKNLQQLYKNKTAPTLFISDGNQTYGEDYTYTSKNYSQEIFPVIVGDTTTFTDLKINQLNVNRYAFLNNKFPVEVFLNYDGEKTIQQQFEIRQGNSVLFSKNIEFSAEKPSTIINTTLPANSVGVKTYTATIRPLEEEKNKVNNSQNFAVEVIDETTNVLLLHDILHPDLGALKKSIESNQQRKAEIKSVEDLENIDLGNYQLVVFYQPTQKFESVFSQVQKLGLHTFTITGTHTDYQFLNENQGFLKKELSNQKEDFLPAYNVNYTSFQFEDVGFNDFPPLEDKFGEIDFLVAHETLLYQSINGIETETSLLATVEDNDKRFGFLFGENSWRWRAKTFVDTENFQPYDEFMGKLIQYLAASKKKERLTLDYQSFYNSGENISLKAQYFDNNYEFDPRAKLIINLINKENSEKKELPLLLKNNLYSVDLSNLPAGEYEFTVRVENENISEKGNLTIIDFDVEKQFLNANMKGMKKLNSSDLYFVNQPEKVIEQLLANDSFKPIQKSKKEISPLIDWFYLLAIIVLSLSLEWFLRKYYGLT